MKVFLDANVLFSSARSQTGASFYIFQLQKKFKFTLITSNLAKEEAERNIKNKENSLVLLSFYALLKQIKVIRVNSQKGKDLFKEVIAEKDAPILYGAERSKADYLLTLDKKHFFTKTLLAQKLPFKIITPGDFLRDHLVEIITN